MSALVVEVRRGAGLRLETFGGAVELEPMEHEGRACYHVFNWGCDGSDAMAACRLARSVLAIAERDGKGLLVTVEATDGRLRGFYRGLGFRDRFVSMER